jgi:hypothetical protein
MAFNIFATQRVSGFGQYNRIDHFMACKLRGDKCPVFGQFLVDESYSSAVFQGLDPLFVWHGRSMSTALIAGLTRTPSAPSKRMKLPLGLARQDWRLDSIRLLSSRGFGHARLRHLFLDGEECRLAGFFLGFLSKHGIMVTRRAKQCSAIWHSSKAAGCGAMSAPGQKVFARRYHRLYNQRLLDALTINKDESFS